MFWTLMVLALALWAAGVLTAITLGGFIHLLPLAAFALVAFRVMAKPPNTQFGRWRPAAERYSRR